MDMLIISKGIVIYWNMNSSMLLTYIFIPSTTLILVSLWRIGLDYNIIPRWRCFINFYLQKNFYLSHWEKHAIINYVTFDFINEVLLWSNYGWNLYFFWEINAYWKIETISQQCLKFTFPKKNYFIYLLNYKQL